MKRALALAAASGMLAFGVAPAATAGEITGGKNPLPTPIKTGGTSASLCAFSGLDDPDLDPFGRTQSYGQMARFAKGKLGFAPSAECQLKAGAEEPMRVRR